MPDRSTLTIILPGRTDCLDNISYALCAQSLFIFLIMAIINKKCNVLPTIIHYVEKGPYVELTRRGKPVAVLLSIQEYERLSHKYTGFWNAVSKFRRKVEDEGIEISDSDFKGLRDLSSRSSLKSVFLALKMAI